MLYRERKKRDSPERFQKDHRPAPPSLARVVTSALRVRAQWSRKNGLFALKWEAVRQTRLLQLFIFLFIALTVRFNVNDRIGVAKKLFAFKLEGGACAMNLLRQAGVKIIT